MPRGGGKSSLLAAVFAGCLHPDGPLHARGRQNVLVAGSIEQGAFTFKPLKGFLGTDDDAYRWTESENRMGCKHLVRSGSGRLVECCNVRVLSSDGRLKLGAGANQRLVVADECSGWQERAGAMLRDALQGSLGKSDMQLVFMSTPVARRAGTTGLSSNVKREAAGSATSK